MIQRTMYVVNRICGHRSDDDPQHRDPQPSRTLALLWGEPSATMRRKGPARSVDVLQVVDAALRLADEQGLTARM